MDNLIKELNNYCCQLLGDEASKGKRKKKRKTGDSCEDASEKTKISSPMSNKTKIRNPIEKTNTAQRFTENVFRGVSETASNYSDNDVPLYEDEAKYENSLSSTQSDSALPYSETEDGFKIVSDIPLDDSDVSDAFESDIDESEWCNEAVAKQEPQKRKIKNNKNDPTTNQLDSNFSTINKPLLKIIQDFGFQDRINLHKASTVPSDKRLQPTHLKSKTILPHAELQVFDYSSKRSRKVSMPVIENSKFETKTTKMSKEDFQKAMKKDRYEVFKFGLRGFAREDQKKAKTDLAIKLGAKPPPKNAVNYKRLIEERKLQRQKEILKREEDRNSGMPAKKPSVEKVRKSGLGNVNPLIGKFKNGVLNISKKDLENINRNS